MPRPRKTGQKQQNDMAKTLDQLAEFEDFKKTILPALEQDIKSGLSAAEIREKYLSIAQARMVMELLNMKSSAAITAAKDMFDRTEGKPKDQIEITERYKELPDADLDALLASKLKGAGEETKKDEQEH